MRVLRIYVTKWNKHEQTKRYLLERRNSMLDFSSEKVKFYSKFEDLPEELQLEISVIEFNQSTAQAFVKAALESSEKAKYLNREEKDQLTGVEKNRGAVAGAISSLIMKWDYNQDERDIFDFVTDLFVRVLMGHFFYNGNKRTSIIFLRTTLWNLGFYLKWSSDEKYIYERTYENDLKGFIQELESKEEFRDQRPAIIEKIKTWIYRNVVIALNFRRAAYIIKSNL